MRTRLLRIAKRALLLALSLLALSALVFFAADMAPGDPLYAYYGESVERMGTEELSLAKQRLGLDQPAYIRYFIYLGNAAKGELGISYKYKQDVGSVIAGRIGNTLLLTGVAYALIFALSVPLAMVSACFEGRWADRLLCRVGVLSGCIPEFYLSLLLILVFSVLLRVLPGGGAYSPGNGGDIADRVRHMLLPVAAIVMSHLFYYAYMLRNRLMDEARSEYVLLARAKGMGAWKILRRHCLRGAMPSFVTLMASAAPHILGGTYIVETVFAYPGIGQLIYESARYKDYNLLMMLAILTGAMVMLMGAAAEAVNALLDPRIARGGGGDGGEGCAQGN